MKKSIMALSLIIVMFIAFGCQNDTKSGLMPGKYLLNGEDEFSYVLVDLQSHFEFSRHIALSYVPRGTYEVEGNTLTLRGESDDVYTFRIYDDTLVLQDEVEGLLKKGSVFILVDVPADN